LTFYESINFTHSVNILGALKMSAAFQNVRTLSASMASSYRSSIQATGHVLDPSRPWDFIHTPQT